MKKKIANKVDSYSLAVKILGEGHGLPYIHKTTGLSLEDLRAEALKEPEFKKRLDQAASACLAARRSKIEVETDNNTDFNRNKLLYEEVLKDVSKIRQVVTETVSQIDIFLVDGDNIKKKI